MADEASKNASPFDLQTIRHLAALMSRHDLSAIDLEDNNWRIRLRRGPRGSAVAPLLAAPAAATPPPTAASSPPAAEPVARSKALFEIKSPTPGTYYSAANPGAEPFVRKGARVTPTTVVGIIEAMKLFNEIPADCSGVIEEILVENQQPVEYGQVLFRVDPAG